MPIKSALAAIAIIGTSALIPSVGRAEKAGLTCRYNVPNCTSQDGYLTGCTWGHEADGKYFFVFALYGSTCSTWVDFEY